MFFFNVFHYYLYLLFSAKVHYLISVHASINYHFFHKLQKNGDFYVFINIFNSKTSFSNSAIFFSNNWINLC